jgi:hypothetical protein
MEIAMEMNELEINELEINPMEEKIDHSHNIVDPEEEEADSDKEYISGPVPATPRRKTTGPRRAFAQLWTVDSALLPQAITDTPREETPKKPKGRPAPGRRSTARPQTDQQELEPGASLRRKTHVSTRRIGYADDADFTGSYLRLDHSDGVFGFLSKSSTLLVRDSPGQPGVALRRLRAPGRGATAPTVDRRRRRGSYPSRRIWAGAAGHSESLFGRNHPIRPTMLRHWYLYGTEWLADLDRCGIDGRPEEWADY